VVWRYVWNPDKKRKDGSGLKGAWDKPPKNARTGVPASSTDPATWCDFKTALRAYRRGRWDGVGFVPRPEDTVTITDLDHCRDPKTGVIEARAQAIVDELKTYTEISPSGTGLRIVASGHKPDNEWVKRGDVEMYDGHTKAGKPGGRYLTFTGHRLEDTPRKVRHCPKAIARIYERELRGTEAAAGSPKEAQAGGGPPAEGVLHLDDEQIIARAKAATNGDKFQRLWAGDTTGYPSPSEADLALLGMLAFWCGPDEARIKRHYRQSGLMRPKAERDDYLDRSIAVVLKDRTDYYKPAGLPDEDDPRPAITITTEEYEVNDQAIAALAADPDLYQRGGLLVHVVTEAIAEKGITRPPAPRIAALPQPLLRERLTSWARWVQVADKGLKPAHPPGWCVSAVFARSHWPGIKPLEGVVTYPVLRLDGTLLLENGYDPDTGLLLAYDGDLPAVPDHPTLQEARRARDRLLDVVTDFPFKAEVHKAAWLASLLTPLCRYAYEGPTPLFLTDANTPGTGKGLLQEVTAHILTGAPFTLAAYTGDEDELRKRITSLVMAGDRCVLLDNLEGKFGNATLNAALTARAWEDRVLGVNKMFRGPMQVVWYATGNNVAAHVDTIRRTVHIHLETREERPEERKDFKHPKLLAWVQARRRKLLAAALTILRGYVAAGRPDLGLTAWGSFEGWSGLVRNAVVWCGLPDPGLTRAALREQSDTTSADVAALMLCWARLDRYETGLTVAEVCRRAFGRPGPGEPESAAECEEYLELRDVIESLVGRNDPGALGRLLRKFRRRVLGGMMFDAISRGKTNAVRWKVVRPNGDDLAGQPERRWPSLGQKKRPPRE
jgi:hypothetical protein